MGSFSLRDINLAVAPGECHAVLGPSGSGKSTLLGAVLGSIPVRKGRILLENQDITHWPMEQRRLGYVPQNLGLFPHLSVHDNLCYSARARSLATDRFQPLLDRLVEITGIGDLLERRIETLSGGERQRVALVRALVADPRLVLLDEPFTALNETLRRELWWLVRDLQREHGLAALLITHDLTEAYFLAGRITVLINGQQHQSGDKKRIYHQPASEAVARFLGIKNLFPATIQGYDGDRIVAECPVLKHHFRLHGKAPLGSAIYIGIRAEEVALRDTDHPSAPGECVLRGSIRLIDLGDSVTMHLHCPSTPCAIEVSASQRVVRRFGLYDGQNGVTVSLPEPALFWVYANST